MISKGEEGGRVGNENLMFVFKLGSQASASPVTNKTL